MAKMLMINPDKCTGCHNCELACAWEHEGRFRMQATRIHVYTWEREGFSTPMMCQQCADAACVQVCTPHALQRDLLTGVVKLNHQKCIGCKMCVQACPFGSAVWDTVSNSIHKCDTCDGDPACAKACPTQALAWVDDSISTRTRKRAYASKLKEAFAE
jgi:carbon-monoxide dehydrogenase iron sulfur subunit